MEKSISYISGKANTLDGRIIKGVERECVLSAIELKNLIEPFFTSNLSV